MQTPILMIHGMCCTGDVWSHFRSFFEARGAKVYTPTLRPDLRVNRNQKPTRALSKLSLHDYVADMELEIDRIERETGETPVVIGHSMGGLITQALAERNRVTAAVLISPATPGGVHIPSTFLFWNFYRLLEQVKLAQAIIKPEYGAVSAMVLNQMPRDQRKAVTDAMTFESGKVFGEFGNFPIDEKKIRAPMLTISARKDRLVTAGIVRKTAQKYAAVGGEFKEYREHGHWLYAEPGWETPAGDIYAWIESAIVRAKSGRAASSAQVQA